MILNLLSKINDYLRLLVSQKGDQNKTQVINILNNIHHHLRLFVFQQRNEDIKQKKIKSCVVPCVLRDIGGFKS